MNRSLLGPFLLVAFVLVCFGLSPHARATCQDACLTNLNTVQGDDALISLTTGGVNTAIGFNALYSNTEGSYNVADAAFALFSNTTGFGNTAQGYQALYNRASRYFDPSGKSKRFWGDLGFHAREHGLLLRIDSFSQRAFEPGNDPIQTNRIYQPQG